MIKSFEEEDFNIHKISLSSNIEEAIDKRLSHGDIDIIALSVVQYASGLFIDINFYKCVFFVSTSHLCFKLICNRISSVSTKVFLAYFYPWS